VWTGRQAKQIGLIDQIGGLERAVDEAKVLAGYTPQTLVALEPYPRARRLWRLPFSIGLPQARLASVLPWWNDARREKLWAVMPLRLRFF
jgi:ClpP class serine protease